MLVSYVSAQVRIPPWEFVYLLWKRQPYYTIGYTALGCMALSAQPCRCRPTYTSTQPSIPSLIGPHLMSFITSWQLQLPTKVSTDG